MVVLFGNDVIKSTVLNIQADKYTRGHRFHHPDIIELRHPKEYEEVLRTIGYVEAVFSERKEHIRRQVLKTAAQLGARPLIDAGLLEEVTALTEWPVAISGSFDEKFLEVPPEVLVATMQKNQKYFPVVDAKGSLLPLFIAISNIQSVDPNQVRQGNERVIRPRFKDAGFFWEQDLKEPLDFFKDQLSNVVFQEKLGTLTDKTKRIAILSESISRSIGVDPILARRAAELSKCDLLTSMVGEFSDLQGIMGRYYASAGGEDDCVAAAMEEQYLPRHAGDSLPVSDCGKILALADRIDSLVGIFAIGQKPTGVKDPYALRRASLGIMRILIEAPMDLDVYMLLRLSADTYQPRIEANSAVEEVYTYMLERLHGYYSNKGIPSDTVESVVSKRITVPADIHRRIEAVQLFRQLPEAESLAVANKRIKNILRKFPANIPDTFDISVFQETWETDLALGIRDIRSKITPMLKDRRYVDALTELAKISPLVNDFFNNVIVMCDDERLRLNRLALLRSLSRIFETIADISLLH